MAWPRNSQARISANTGSTFMMAELPTTPRRGSTVMRTAEDGTQTTYTYNASLGLYVAHEGLGAQDTLKYDSANLQWVWTDGATQNREIYDLTGKLSSLQDINGHAVTLSYTSGKIDTITDDNGESVQIHYDSSNRIIDVTTSYKSGSGTTVQLKRVSYGYNASATDMRSHTSLRR